MLDVRWIFKMPITPQIEQSQVVNQSPFIAETISTSGRSTSHVTCDITDTIKHYSIRFGPKPKPVLGNSHTSHVVSGTPFRAETNSALPPLTWFGCLHRSWYSAKFPPPPKLSGLPSPVYRPSNDVLSLHCSSLLEPQLDQALIIYIYIYIYISLNQNICCWLLYWPSHTDDRPQWVADLVSLLIIRRAQWRPNRISA